MDAILTAALAYREMGLAVHWLHPNSKAPVSSAWSSAPVMSLDELRASYCRGFNVGFRPGKWSKVGDSEIVVLDIDVRGGEAFASEAYAAAATLMGGNLEPSVRSGSGVGRHVFLRVPIGESPESAATTVRQSDLFVCDGVLCSSGIKRARPVWLIELLSTGKNVVLPPSIHPDTGAPYVLL